MKPLGTVALGGSVDDLEALAPSPAGLWLVGSQSTNKDAEARPLRERIALLGHPPFAPDLSACAACVDARGRAPNAGGLNVEGAAWHGGKLWLGLRAPLVGGRALMLETEATPAAARVTRVVPIDLGGQAVRDLAAWKGGLLVVAGPVSDTDAAHTAWWLSAPDAVPQRLPLALPPSAEGLAVNDAGVALVVTDGDGKSGRPCKEPATWMHVTLPAPATAPAGP